MGEQFHRREQRRRGRGAGKMKLYVGSEDIPFSLRATWLENCKIASHGL